MFIVRVKTDSRGVRYGSLEEGGPWVVRFQAKYRHKRGGFAELEQVGVNRSAVEMWFSEKSAVDARGFKGRLDRSTHFRLLDRHEHLRRLREDDVERLAEFDQEIAEQERKLKEIRDRRAEHVQKAWRRGEKIPINELEERAEAHPSTQRYG